MRFVLAGILLLAALATPQADAQAEGEVESIGFQGHYRPNCWTPMKVRLRSKIATPATYRLKVVQEDIDGDRVSYTRPITLNASVEGRRVEEHAWLYFLPQLRDLANARTPQEFTALIKVFLCDEDGKQLVQLPIPAGVGLFDVDSPNTSGFGRRGNRFVVAVVAGGHQHKLREYRDLYGVVEDLVFVNVTVNELPTSVLAYQAVDHVVWFNADPTQLSADAAAAIEEYVRDGGKLVVTQNREWQKTKDSPLAQMLPVVLSGDGQERNATTLRMLARIPDFTEQRWNPDFKPGPEWMVILDNRLLPYDPWRPLEDVDAFLCHAVPRPGAVVAMWSVGEHPTPYIVRGLHGYGGVTWVAQDLSDPALIATTRDAGYGWARIWEKVLALPGNPIPGPNVPVELKHFNRREAERLLKEANRFQTTSSGRDISGVFRDDTNHNSTATAFVAVAILFFIGYWVVAGPGAYFFLLARRRQTWNWFAFGLCAGVATLLTLLIVHFVVRGKPDLRHVSLVRMGPAQDALVAADVGLYVREDGVQRLELKETSPGRTTYVAPLAAHPMIEGSDAAGGFISYLEYDVPIRDRASTGAPFVDMPFRSTSKKIELKWAGQPKHGGIDSTLEMTKEGNLRGTIANNTGMDLRKAWLVWKNENNLSESNTLKEETKIQTTVLELGDPTGPDPVWPRNATLTIQDVYAKAYLNTNQRPAPGTFSGFRGTLESTWPNRWPRGALIDTTANLDRDLAALMLSIFDLIPPSEETADRKRHELSRLMGRHWDMSHVVSAGQMLVVAVGPANSPVPVPFTVSGDPVTGQGLTYYQFVVPINRPPADPPEPTTRPTTLPTTRPAAAPQPPPPNVER